jgi:hypothetical protein
LSSSNNSVAAPNLSKSLFFGFYVACVLLVLAQLLAAICPGHIGDSSIYASYAHLMTSGHLPYSADFRLEYPPGVLPFILLAIPLGKLAGLYIVGFVMLTVISVGLFLSYRHYKGGQRALLLAALLLVPLLQFVFFELDIFAALALYGAVCAITRRKYTWSAVLLAASTLIKAYPGVCLLGLLWVVPRGRRRNYLLVFAGLLAIGLLPALITEPRGLWYAVTYHTGRPVEIGASGAAVGLVLHLFGRPAQIIDTHASWALLFPGESIVNTLSSLGLLLSLIWVCAMAWRGRLQPKPVTLSLILLLFYIVWFKVGSPQYIIAALLILPLAGDELGGRLQRQLIKRFLAVSTVMWLFFTLVFDLKGAALGSGAWLITALSCTRVIMLAGLIVLLCRSIWQTPTPVSRGRQGNSGRAKTTASIRSAPAARRTKAAASNVAPVVETSSTRMTWALPGMPALLTRKAAANWLKR